MSDEQKVEMVKDKSIITIQLSGSFYKRIQAVMLHLSEYRDASDITELVRKINEEESSDNYDDWEVSMETLMILCSEVETKAKEQDAIETVDLNALQKKQEESTN